MAPEARQDGERFWARPAVEQRHDAFTPARQRIAVDQLVAAQFFSVGRDGAKGRIHARRHVRQASVNTPPLDVTALRHEWRVLREHARAIPPARLLCVSNSQFSS